MKKAKKDVLYFHVDKKNGLKKWLSGLSKKQIGSHSLSFVAERILMAAKKDRKFIKSAMLEVK